jgi:coenzyme F420-0:L-glutamate ligase/coenzyme F420-1:gamma-L-glutamate ligase
MDNKINIESLPQVPSIKEGDEVGKIIVDAAEAAEFQFQEHDILCIASKVVSVAEGRVRALKSVQVSEAARRIHQQVPRKDERVIQVIIDETGMPDGSRIEVSDNYIGGWIPNGLRLTSAGVDKKDTEHVYLLPADPDASARAISKKILAAASVHVGVIITDSDGRIEKAGATQVAIGTYGVPSLRKTESRGQDGSMSAARFAEISMSC